MTLMPSTGQMKFHPQLSFTEQYSKPPQRALKSVAFWNANSQRTQTNPTFVVRTTTIIMIKFGRRHGPFFRHEINNTKKGSSSGNVARKRINEFLCGSLVNDRQRFVSLLTKTSRLVSFTLFLSPKCQPRLVKHLGVAMLLK